MKFSGVVLLISTWLDSCVMKIFITADIHITPKVSVLLVIVLCISIDFKYELYIHLPSSFMVLCSFSGEVFLSKLLELWSKFVLRPLENLGHIMLIIEVYYTNFFDVHESGLTVKSMIFQVGYRRCYVA
ncbi:hypothetical protein CUMW_091290, partial [Citrus unshiu]